MFHEVQHQAFFLLNMVVSWLSDILRCLRLSLSSVNWQRQKGARRPQGAGVLAEGNHGSAP